MAQITLHQNSSHTSGELPELGKTVHFSKLVKSDLSEVSTETFAGKTKVLNIFPSIDTPTCATSVRKFNQEAAQLKDTVVINISLDLPFAQARFCGAEGIKNCETLSAFRSTFGQEFGVSIIDGPLKGLLARAVVVLSSDNKVLYTELVKEISHEPNYENALKILKRV